MSEIHGGRHMSQRGREIASQRGAQSGMRGNLTRKANVHAAPAEAENIFSHFYPHSYTYNIMDSDSHPSNSGHAPLDMIYSLT